MKQKIAPSHVAILVPSVRKAAEALRRFDFEIGEEESFEETKEIYVQGSERNSLLLMEPKKTGSYRRALEKRGPGLHHLAIDVLDLEGFLATLAGSGWFLHPNSLKTIERFRAAYLARPGFPGLIEVQEKKKLRQGKDFVEGVTLKFDATLEALLKPVGLAPYVRRAKSNQTFTLRGREIPLKQLL
jgi:hypothetical protein